MIGSGYGIYGTLPTATLLFFATCASCPNEGPDALTEQEANDRAVAEGWSVREVKIGDKQMKVYTCPKCARSGKAKKS
ncbi:MAG: hypothetical protein HY865_00895 [Chloroflexi bacterium]|nr:hypothetical protein [Chloroflexota bacterium]